MPKIIDSDERKKAIAQAVWSILSQQGISKVTIRNVAAQAGISTGSLSRSFANRMELVHYALELINEDANNRFQAYLASEPSALASVQFLESFLPLEPYALEASKVTVGMIAELSALPEIAPIAQGSLEQLQLLFREVLNLMDRQGELKAGLDLELESTQLVVLSYGLTVKALVAGKGSEPLNVSRIFRSQVNELLLEPVPYATDQELAELAEVSRSLALFKDSEN